VTINKLKAGFSLVEVMVAVAITSIVGAMIATMMSHMGNVASFYSTKEDYDSIYRAAQLLLLNEQTCKYALKNASGVVATFSPSATKTPLDTIFIANVTSPSTGTNLIKVGEKFHSRLSIRSIDIQEHSPGNGRGTVVITDASGVATQRNTFLVDLNITADNISGGPAIAVKPIPLTIVVDGSNNIIDCYAQSSSAAICAVLHAQLNPATGQCVIPDCPGASPPPCPTPPVAGAVCVAPTYFLAFTTTGVPTCQCVQTCSGPQGAQGPAGAAGPAGPPPPPPGPIY
jgi:prepilin-type N-terminal cleavage/methylation domain-containing protein